MNETNLARGAELIMKRNKSYEDMLGLFSLINGRPEDAYLPAPADWQQQQAIDEEEMAEEAARQGQFGVGA